MAIKGQGFWMTYLAFDTENNVGKTGDSANHTISLLKDGSLAAATNSPSEIDATDAPGYYKVYVEDSEADYDAITLCGVSSTASVVIAPVTVLTDRGLVYLVSDLVESQRGAHTWGGQVFYVAPKNGNDTTGTGSRSLPYKTVTKALSMCIDNNHDVIFLVPDDTVSPTVLTEDITFNKSYTFLRGPGRDFKIISTAGPSKNAIQVTANGVELSGFVTTSNGLVGTPIKVQAADFCYIHDVFIESPTQDGIEVAVGTNTRIRNCTIVGCGRDGVRITSGAGSGYYTLILESVIRDSVGSAVYLQGTDSSECRIQRNIIRDNAIGVSVGGGVVDTVITDNRFINNSTADVVNNGTRTLNEWNKQADLSTSGLALEATSQSILSAITLSGTRTITIQLYETGTTTPIPEASLTIMNGDDSLALGVVTTDTNGRVVIGRNDGDYNIRGNKAGYQFTLPDPFTVSADATVTKYADNFYPTVPAPLSGVRCYELCYMPDGSTPMTSVTAVAKIVNLPYNYNGRYHSGQEIDGTYNSTTGVVYWDMPPLAEVEFFVKYIHKNPVVKTIPDDDPDSTIRIKDIT